MERKPKWCEKICYPTKESLKNYEFQSRDFYLSLLFKSNRILKLEDKVLIENF